MTDTFTDLHERASQEESFNYLYDIITSRENILLAYRQSNPIKGQRHQVQMEKPSMTLKSYQKMN